MQNLAISVKDLRKSFKLPHSRQRTVKGLFVNIFKKGKTYEKQQVLKGISFDVKKGEFFGIVGRNGGGKSTLLKLLAGIYSPDSGHIQVNGKLTPFIELGVGFNPELTGKENVYLNGALLGLSKREMDFIYDEIVSFAELERFMDQKLRNYSSGMQVRLAFSVAIQARTEILLIDEVLAVGDSNFQKKCFDTFEEFKREGRTVVFISHSMEMVQKFCDRVIMIDNGKIVAEGEPEVVAAEYEMRNSEIQRSNKSRLAIKNPREAKIVEKIIANFDVDKYCIEIGSAGGRNVDLLSSLGYKVYGVDRLEQPEKKAKNVYFKSLDEIKDTKKITGLFILDNRKSLDIEYISDLFKELDGGKLSNISRIFVHMPFYMFQEFSGKKEPKSYSHLGKPINTLDIAILLSKLSFVQIYSEIYGVDFSCQYSIVIFDRFDDKKQANLWES